MANSSWLDVNCEGQRPVTKLSQCLKRPISWTKCMDTEDAPIPEASTGSFYVQGVKLCYTGPWF